LNFKCLWCDQRFGVFSSVKDVDTHVRDYHPRNVGEWEKLLKAREDRKAEIKQVEIYDDRCFIMSLIGVGGSGKSLFATQIAIQDLSKGIIDLVISDFEINIPSSKEEYLRLDATQSPTGRALPEHEALIDLILAIDQSKLMYLPTSHINKTKLQEISSDLEKKLGRPPKILLIVDEAYALCDPRRAMDSRIIDFCNFLSQIRHYGYQVILIMPTWIEIDPRARQLTKLIVLCAKILKNGTAIFLRSFQKVDMELPKGLPKRKRVMEWKIRPLYPLYNSHDKSIQTLLEMDREEEQVAKDIDEDSEVSDEKADELLSVLVAPNATSGERVGGESKE
jgi:hypothetical protein